MKNNFLLNNIILSETNYLKYLFDKYLSNFCGFLNNEIFYINQEVFFEKTKIAWLDFPHYERMVYKNNNINISYHISGYSVNTKEVFKKIFGESIERYSTLVGTNLLSSEIVDKDINSNELPLELINIYSEEQLKNISKLFHIFSNKKLDNFHELKSIILKNYKNNENYLIPLQLFLLSGNTLDLKVYCSSVTTGTATHINLNKALINSIIEIIQIHNFMKFWYFTNEAEIIKIDEIKQKVNYFKNIEFNYQLFFLRIIDRESNLFTILCFIVRDKFPYFTVGIQSDFSLENAIIRSYEECLAVYKASIAKYVYDVEDKDILIDKDNVFNFDENVLYWALNYKNNPRNYFNENIMTLNFVNFDELKNKEISFNNDENKLLNLFKVLKKLSNFIFIKDITSPEFSQDFVVTRVLTPDLFSLFHPSFPPLNHPFIKKEKLKIKNNFLLHPLA